MIEKVRINALFLALMLVVGNAWSQAMPNAGGTQPEIRLRMIAIEGTTTNGNQVAVANSLRELRGMLENIESADTFTEVARREVLMEPNGPTQIEVNSRYTLRVTYPEPTADGNLRTKAEVLQHEGTTKLIAYSASLFIPLGGSMRFRDLDGPTGGELIIVMQFVQEQDPNESGSESSESDQPEESEQQDQSDQEQSEEESEGEQEPQPQPEDEGEDQEEDEQPQPEQDTPLDQQEEGDEEDQEPQELDNLEAILESLEEMDNREQMEMRNRPRRVQSAGDWW